MPSKVCEIVSAQKLIRPREGLLLGGRSLSAVNLPNPDYQVKSEYFSIISEALNSAQSELQLCLPKYVK